MVQVPFAEASITLRAEATEVAGPSRPRLDRVVRKIRPVAELDHCTQSLQGSTSIG
jgi:hypothetical protein